MIAYGYCRVSTDRQADGLSLEIQQEKIEAAATINDFDLAEIICDAGASGRDLKRPGMARLLSLIAQGRVDVVICARLDRITRSTVDLGRLVETLQKARRADGGHGVHFVSCAEQLDTSTAAGRLVINVLGVVAQFERERISERVGEALQMKKARGEAAGEPPFGFDKAGERGRLIPNETEQAVLSELRALRAAGVKWVRIPEVLNGNGHRNRIGRPFTRQGIRSVAQTAGIR